MGTQAQVTLVVQASNNSNKDENSSTLSSQELWQNLNNDDVYDFQENLIGYELDKQNEMNKDYDQQRLHQNVQHNIDHTYQHFHTQQNQ